MIKIIGKIKNIVLYICFLAIFNVNQVFAFSAPTEDEVNEIAGKGLKMFFGVLAGFAVLMGGMELYGAFMAHRENVEQGGFGGAQNKVQQKIIAGIMCFIAAVIIYVVMHWVQSLFDIS